jgi:hypothetical protein
VIAARTKNELLDHDVGTHPPIRVAACVLTDTTRGCERGTRRRTSVGRLTCTPSCRAVPK